MSPERHGIRMILTNSQYNKILRVYDNRRIQNKYDLDFRTEEVYKKIPMLNEINQAIVSNSINHAKSALLGDENAVSTLKDANLVLSMQKVELLIANGYPGDYLSLTYHCPDCQDTGYINNEKCHCFKQAIVDLIYSQETLKSIITRENFSTFSYDYYTNDYIDATTKSTPLTNIKKVVNSCKDFINTFSSSYQNILLYGNTGVGKTFLANCIANELLSQAHTVIYLTSFQLFDILEKDKFSKEDTRYTKERRLDFILQCDLLIIDDLGTEMNNSFISSQLYNCINERHLNQKSTIISTNLTLDLLSATYSERIFSRITGNYMLLKIVGDDIRYKKTFS